MDASLICRFCLNQTYDLLNLTQNHVEIIKTCLGIHLKQIVDSKTCYSCSTFLDSVMEWKQMCLNSEYQLFEVRPFKRVKREPSIEIRHDPLEDTSTIGAFSCDLCPETFHNQMSIRNHIQKVHVKVKNDASQSLERARVKTVNDGPVLIVSSSETEDDTMDYCSTNNEDDNTRRRSSYRKFQYTGTFATRDEALVAMESFGKFSQTRKSKDSSIEYYRYECTLNFNMFNTNSKF